MLKESKDLNNGFYIKQISNGLKKSFDKTLVEYDITNEQAHILLYLMFNLSKKINQRDIEKRFNLRNSTISGILTRLENKNLIKRVIDDKDNRNKIIEVTNKTYELKSILDENKTKVEEMLVFGMNELEKDEFNKLLLKAAENIMKWSCE